MSYWLEDESGDFLGDFATNHGIITMRERAGPLLMELLDNGELPANKLRGLGDEVKESPELVYISDLVVGAEGSVFITDGCGSADMGEQDV